jgi:hypothetical protein
MGDRGYQRQQRVPSVHQARLEAVDAEPPPDVDHFCRAALQRARGPRRTRQVAFDGQVPERRSVGGFASGAAQGEQCKNCCAAHGAVSGLFRGVTKVCSPIMGVKSQAFFNEANRLAGLLGKIRLASLAQITSTEASSADDRPEIIARLEAAMIKLKAEFKETALSGEIAIRVAAPGGREARALRRHIQAYLDLMTQRALFLGNVDETVRRVNEAAATTLDVARVSVWWLSNDRSKITCADLFERDRATHESGVELFAKDFGPYFEALESERTIAAHDAHVDPRTSCFSNSYLGPLGITSMLDVPIWVRRRMVGVICHEHIGPKRGWDSDEETFGYLMANFVALALERPALSAASPRSAGG